MFILSLYINAFWYKAYGKLNNEWYEHCTKINNAWYELIIKTKELDNKEDRYLWYSKLESVMNIKME